MQTLGLASMLQKKYIGTDELRRDLTEILDKLPSEGGEIVITQHGKPQAIMLDMESYLELQETLEDLSTPGFIDSIHQTAQEMREGNSLSLEQLKKELGH